MEKPPKDIIQIVKENNIDELKALLLEEPDFDKVDEQVAMEDRAILIDTNAASNTPYVSYLKGLTALHYAAALGYTDCLKELIKAGANIEAKTLMEQIPLHVAAAYGKASCVDELIKAGANVHQRTDNGFTPLRLASVYGHEDTAKVLLAAGATHDTVLQPMTLDDYARSIPEGGKVVDFAENTAQEKVLKGINSVNKGEKKRKNIMLFALGSTKSESAELFTSLLEEESYELFETRDMIVGQQGVGKTTLASFLVGKVPSEIAIPTDGIGLYTGLAFIDKEARKWYSGKIGFTLEELLVSRLLKVNPLEGKQTSFLKTEIITKVEPEPPLGLAHISPLHEAASCSKKRRSNDSTQENVLEHSSIDNDKTQKISASVSKFYLLQKSWEVGDKNLHKMNLSPVIIWDFGGHDVFYATHQTFLTYRAMYIIVIDGSKPLDAVVDCSHQYLPGKAGQKICRDYIVFWIKAILTYCIKIGDGYPKLLIVATHKDNVPSEKLEVVRKTLYDEIDTMFTQTIQRHLVTEHRLFVNATDHGDPEMVLLKQVLTDLAFKQPTWGEKMPACFLPLELELHHLVHQAGKKVITLADLDSINDQLPIRPLSRQELNLFLKVQHAIGKLLYFPLPDMDQKVILAPTHLIDAFRSIITEREFCGQDQKRLSSWDDLANKGIIQKSTIEYIWKKEEFKHFEKEKKYLLTLMTHLEFISEPRRYDKDGGLLQTDFFLVPSMVRNQDNTVVPPPFMLSTGNRYSYLTFWLFDIQSQCLVANDSLLSERPYFKS